MQWLRTRSLLALPLAAASVSSSLCACGGETGFSKSTAPPATEQGVGEIDVQPVEIVIDEIDWENRISEGQVVTISNVGDNNLRVLDVALTSNGGGALYLEEVGELNLAPGASVEFSVLATLSTFEVVESALRIQSGDVDESSLAIPIVAIPAGYEYVPGDTGGSGDTGS